MIEIISWLIPLLPLLASVLIGIGIVTGRIRGEAGEPQTAMIALAGAWSALLLTLLLDLQAIINGAPGQIASGNWFSSANYNIPLSLGLDPLGLVMATLVSVLCLLTLRFSVNYMHREDGFQRFFMVMSLFNGAMLLIVMAGNAVLTFVGWELAGVSSFLLIGYLQQSPEATRNANRVFITNRIGDAGFILGIALAFYHLQSVEWSTINQAATQMETLTARLIAIGFVLAALVKSAQVPFSPWIGRALEGPTPSSAIFYGAVMVHAGVYLLIRLQPLIEHVPLLMVILVVLGALTTLYGWLSGQVQSDVKSALMFSTTSQVGLMFIWCGLGWFELATVHLIAHALVRAWQFLHAPALLHLASGPARPVGNWLQRCPWLYVAAIQRFWLDHAADWLLLHPTRDLAREVQEFDDKVVNRMVGLPVGTGVVSSLEQWEKRSQTADNGSQNLARGFAGRILEGIANLLYWFEQQLVLKGSGEGLKQAIHRVGGYLNRIDSLLAQPRYLLLLVMATIVVII